MSLRVLVEGLGDVAPHVVYGATKLETAAQGQPSAGVVTLRDFGASPTDFITGKRMTVDLGLGTLPIWAGYLQRASRRFWFPVDDPYTLHRQWLLTVIDINILFSRRVVFKVSSPATVLGPLYVNDTPDTVAIAELVSNWLDLSSDDIDVTSKVQNVGNINAGQATYPWNGGMLWGEAMRVIAQLPAGIFALSPSRELVYGDVDVEDAPFELSDRPSGSQQGYRESTIWLDGTKLGNDVLSWGAGKGADQMVFKRLSSPSSIADHNLWQVGTLLYDVWKQATIDKVSDRIINGSPGSKRGQKKDVESVDLVTFADGLRVGQRVRYINEEYAYDQVLPVRRMQIEPVTKDTIRYTMKLSEELDEWGFADPLPPFPGFGTSPPPVIIIPGPIEMTPGGCTDDICGITDTFTRSVGVTRYANNTNTIGPYVGASEAGPTWSVTLSGNVEISVDGSQLVADLKTFSSGATPGNPASGKIGLLLPGTEPLISGSTKSFRFKFDTLPRTPPDPVNDGSDSILVTFGMDNAGTAVETQINIFRLVYGDPSNIANSAASAVTIPDAFWVVDTWYTVTMVVTPTSIDSIISDGTTSYEASGTFTGQSNVNGPYINVRRTASRSTNVGANNTFPDINFFIDDVNIPEFTACTQFGFETWNRTLASQWGTSTPTGHPWVLDSGTASGLSVSGGYGVIGPVSGVTFEQLEINSTEWRDGGGFTMRSSFKANAIITSGAHPSLTWQVYSPGLDNLASLVLRVAAGSADSRVEVFSNDLDEFTVLPDFVADTLYFVAWEHTPGATSRAKVWLATDAEPDWQVSRVAEAGITTETDSVLQVIGTGAGNAVTYSIGPINFTFAGKDCREECVGVDLANPFDTLDDRTTTSPDWGSSSRDGITYQNVTAIALVSGGFGILEHAYSTSGLATQAKVRLTSGPPIGSGDWEIAIKFRYPVAPSPSETNTITHAQATNVEQLQLTGVGNVSPLTKFDLSFGPCKTNGPSVLPGVWYMMKFRWEPSTHTRYSKNVWLWGDAEPAYIATALSPTLNMNLTRLDIGLQTASAGAPSQPVNAKIEIDWIDFNNSDPLRICTNDPEASGGIIGSGWTCENLFADGSTRLQLHGYFLQNTTEVTVAGRRFALGVDYVEGSDSKSVEFIRSTPVDGTAVVVCYNLVGFAPA